MTERCARARVEEKLRAYVSYRYTQPLYNTCEKYTRTAHPESTRETLYPSLHPSGPRVIKYTDACVYSLFMCTLKYVPCIPRRDPDSFYISKLMCLLCHRSKHTNTRTFPHRGWEKWEKISVHFFLWKTAAGSNLRNGSFHKFLVFKFKKVSEFNTKDHFFKVNSYSEAFLIDADICTQIFLKRSLFLHNLMASFAVEIIKKLCYK